MWLVGRDVRGPRTPEWSGMNQSPLPCWTRGSSLLLPTLLYWGGRGCSKGRTTITGRRSCPLDREPVSCKMVTRVSKSRGIVLFRTTHQACGLINVYVGDSAPSLQCTMQRPVSRMETRRSYWPWALEVCRYSSGKLDIHWCLYTSTKPK